MDADFELDFDTVCTRCGRDSRDSIDYCPDCCPNGGLYRPGTEQCELCAWAEECCYFTYSQVKG